MEKLLWNLAGILIIIANGFAVLFCLLTGNKIWCVVLLVLAAVDLIYMWNRPTWLEV